SEGKITLSTILRKKIYTHSHTHSYYPNPCCTLGLRMCFSEYVCVCVWALLSRREMETKRRERENGREKKKEQDTTTSTKGGQPPPHRLLLPILFFSATISPSNPLCF
uniref:Uncharacterized protein n=1 Tax=Scophthalmus maximus TaxID=52904 RepID=A0A8D3BEV7_SCOMX